MKDHSFVQMGTITLAGIQAKLLNRSMIIPARRLFLAVGWIARGDSGVVAQFARTITSGETGIEFVHLPDQRIVPVGGIVDGMIVSPVTPMGASDIERKPIYVVAPGYEAGFDLFGGVTIFQPPDSEKAHLEKVYVVYYVCTRDMLQKIRERGVCW